jgi:osmotically-inducible protein OsmY
MKKIIFILALNFSALAVWSQTAAIPNGTLAPGPVAVPRPSNPTSDDLQLAANVKDQVKAKVRGIPIENYSISSLYGQVTIQGQVRNAAEAEEILAAARSTPGVKAVVNSLTVTPQF